MLNAFQLLWTQIIYYLFFRMHNDFSVILDQFTWLFLYPSGFAYTLSATHVRTKKGFKVKCARVSDGVDANDDNICFFSLFFSEVVSRYDDDHLIKKAHTQFYGFSFFFIVLLLLECGCTDVDTSLFTSHFSSVTHFNAVIQMNRLWRNTKLARSLACSLISFFFCACVSRFFTRYSMYTWTQSGQHFHTSHTSVQNIQDKKKKFKRLNGSEYTQLNAFPFINIANDFPEMRTNALLSRLAWH